MEVTLKSHNIILLAYVTIIISKSYFLIVSLILALNVECGLGVSSHFSHEESGVQRGKLSGLQT